MHKSLLLTLGHNSSAILLSDGRLVCGYEEERLTGIKSDSHFPEQAIKRCMQLNGADRVDEVYVTHWEPFGDLGRMSTKHWDPTKLPEYSRLLTHTGELTHHDTHAHTAIWYANGEPWYGQNDEEPVGRAFTSVKTLLMVCDGFGNFGEHISIYEVSDEQPKLLTRSFGYDGSLGLMYQYMTAFLGLKMHEDEYKLLGYEAHISEVDVDLGLLEKEVRAEVNIYLNAFFHPPLVANRDPVIQLGALPGIQLDLINRWTKICKRLSIEDPKSYQGRVILSYIAQTTLQVVVQSILSTYNYTNLIVTGGVFYNVKLNRKLLDIVPGQLCVCPLAGDQGNAIGLFRALNQKGLDWPGHLCWGHRPKESMPIGYPGLEVTSDWDFAVKVAQREIETNGMVNVVQGAMEFGPRALCNTTTFALPYPEVVDRINHMNGRNTIMPMAPVVTQDQFLSRFSLTHRVHMSHHHMVVAFPYKHNAWQDVMGAAHDYGMEATGRPQVEHYNSLAIRLLETAPEKLLINTSFNVHGHPIVYGPVQTAFNHLWQRTINPNITTIYLQDAQ